MHIAGFLWDVEGVLVADKRYQAVAGAVDFAKRVRAAGCPFRLISNNTTDDLPAIVAKLQRAGFDFTPSEVHTCAAEAVRRLRELHLHRCLVLGSPELRQILTAAGFELTDAIDVDAVVVGMNLQMTYDDLQRACEAVLVHNAAFIALHQNRLFTDAEGRLAPSVGAIVAAIEHATQATPILIGKPSREYFQLALDELGLPVQRVLMVSDDPLSDLAGAKRMGMQTAFVHSGKYADNRVLEQVAEDLRPDIIVPRISDLLTDGGLVLEPAARA